MRRSTLFYREEEEEEEGRAAAAEALLGPPIPMFIGFDSEEDEGDHHHHDHHHHRLPAKNMARNRNGNLNGSLYSTDGNDSSFSLEPSPSGPTPTRLLKSPRKLWTTTTTTTTTTASCRSRRNNELMITEEEEEKEEEEEEEEDPCRRRRRQLRLNGEDSVAGAAETTPPYKKVRALRLFDSPRSPTTLLEKSTLGGGGGGRQSGGGGGAQVPRRLFQQSDANAPRQTSGRNGDADDGFCCVTPKGPSGSYVSVVDSFIRQQQQQQQQESLANVNPFTANGMLLTNSGMKRRRRGKTSLNGSLSDTTLEDYLEDDDDCSFGQPTKKLALRETNIPRYKLEFLEICLIGTGAFGSVYKCINRLDGCVYALKKSLKPVAGSAYEQNAMNEVYAHAVLGKHTNVVRYYSAWAEDNHMVIQNEYCNGGSLADIIAENARFGRSFSEQDLKLILIHITEGLKYIHESHLAHMDIKPGNIFVSRASRIAPKRASLDDDGFEDDELEDGEVVYKIGDLGHVTSLGNPRVEEGDCRYLPLEILHEDYSHLPKADVFALGLTVLEAAMGKELPKNGDEWHDIRAGCLPRLDRYSKEFNKLLKKMIHQDPEARPSSAELSQHSVLCPYGDKTKAQLRRELNAEKLKNELLSRRLQEAAKCLEGITSATNSTPGENASSRRLVGKKVNRSISVTNF